MKSRIYLHETSAKTPLTPYVFMSISMGPGSHQSPSKVGRKAKAIGAKATWAKPAEARSGAARLPLFRCPKRLVQPIIENVQVSAVSASIKSIVPYVTKIYRSVKPPCTPLFKPFFVVEWGYKRRNRVYIVWMVEDVGDCWGTRNIYRI